MNRESATVSPAALRDMLSRGEAVNLVDVRTPGEFASAHVQGSRLHPLDAMDPDAIRDEVGQEETLYLICQSGSRARKAQVKLVEAGLRAVVVEGGATGCDTAGLPMVRGRGPIPLQRQAMIGAGMVIWLGLLLGWFVSPWFLLLIAFAGCGLILAGAMDICLMAILLARMPWNRRAPGSPGAACGPSSSA